ncbi:MAG: acyl-CoA carboxylase subunit beta [Halobacteriales archaeon]
MKIRIEDDADEEMARAVVAAVSQHLGKPVEMVAEDGSTVASAGEKDDWDDEGQVVTEREEGLRDKIEGILAGRKQEKQEKLDELDKLFVRERLDLLFDEIEYEDGTFASYSNDEELPADGVVTGVGRIDGRKVCFTANDYTVKAGTLGKNGAEKIIRIQEKAMRLNVPLIRLIDSAGARLNQEERDPGDTHADRYTGGKMFYNQCRMSGKIPQIGVLYGPDIAGSAYTPVFCDYLIMVEEMGSMAIASARIVEAMIGESVDMQELGGADVHSKHSGSADVVVEDEEEAVEKIKKVLSYLPQNYGDEPPRSEPRQPSLNPRGLDAVIPEKSQKDYDVQEVIDRLVDRDSWLELKPEYGREIVTGLGKIAGRPVGVVANQPKVNGGAIFPDAADKASGFVWTCDSYNIPLVYLCDTPGFMVGTRVEKQGVLRKGRKFIYATSNAQVPKISVLTRKAYGAGIYAMAGPSFGPDYVLGLPSTEIAVMGPEAAVHALFGEQLKQMEGDALESTKEMFKQEYDKYIDIEKQASQMEVDELVPAGDLREQLVRRLEVLETKERRDVDRHHGTVLF